MRDHALKVVEAVRALQLIDRKGRTISQLDLNSLGEALDSLRKAMEEFDSVTGYSAAELTLRHRPEFATPLQMADDSYVSKVLDEPFADNLELAEASAELEVNETPREPRPAVQLTKPILAAAFLAHMSAVPDPEPHGQRKRLVAVSNGVYHDGQQYVHELRLAVNAINDKLTHAVRKIGWNPRLRRLAKTLKMSQQDINVEMKNGRSFVMIPSDQWGKLSVAIAESALNQDLTVEFPQPKPALGLNLDNERTLSPRPPRNFD